MDHIRFLGSIISMIALVALGFGASIACTGEEGSIPSTPALDELYNLDLTLYPYGNAESGCRWEWGNGSNSNPTRDVCYRMSATGGAVDTIDGDIDPLAACTTCGGCRWEWGNGSNSHPSRDVCYRMSPTDGATSTVDGDLDPDLACELCGGC